MSLPDVLQSLIDEALRIVEQHPDHEYGPRNRGKLMRAFRDLNTPLADRARRRLAILTARHVLPLHSGPHPSEEQLRQMEAERASMTPEQRREFDEIERQDTHYEEPIQAIELAERVMRGEFDAGEALHIAADMHQRVGFHRSVPSMFAQYAANTALGEVASRGGKDIFDSTDARLDMTDVAWAFGPSDTAASAAAAWSCVVDASQVDPDDWPNNWNWWIREKSFDRDKLLEFWRWWLSEAIPEAWAIEEAGGSKPG